METLRFPPLPGPFDEPMRLAERHAEAAARAASALAPDAAREDALDALREQLARARRSAAVVAAWPPTARRFLVAEENPDLRFLVTRLIRRLARDACVVAVGDGAEALGALEVTGEGDGVVVISDDRMGGGRSGAHLLDDVASKHPKARRILFTAEAPERVDPFMTTPHAVVPKEGSFGPLRQLLASL